MMKLSPKGVNFYKTYWLTKYKMEPVVILVLGILIIVGQSQSYGINADTQTNLMHSSPINTRHYASEDKIEHPSKYAHSTSEDETLAKNAYTKFKLTGDPNFIYKKQEQLAPRHVEPQYTNLRQAHSDNGNNQRNYSNSNSQGNNGNSYNMKTNSNEYNRKYNGYGNNQLNNYTRIHEGRNGNGINQRYNVSGNNQINNGSWYDQEKNSKRHNQRPNGKINGAKKRNNGYLVRLGDKIYYWRYTGNRRNNSKTYNCSNNQENNGNSYSHGHKDQVNSNLNNIVKTLIQNKIVGLPPGVAYNQMNPLNIRKKFTYNAASTSPDLKKKEVYSGGQFPDTVYTYNPKSVTTYKDDNSEVITVNDNHITYVQPKRDKAVIRATFPSKKVTIYTDVPANDNIPRDNTQIPYSVTTPKPTPHYIPRDNTPQTTYSVMTPKLTPHYIPRDNTQITYHVTTPKPTPQYIPRDNTQTTYRVTTPKPTPQYIPRENTQTTYSFTTPNLTPHFEVNYLRDNDNHAHDDNKYVTFRNNNGITINPNSYVDKTNQQTSPNSNGQVKNDDRNTTPRTGYSWNRQNTDYKGPNNGQNNGNNEASFHTLDNGRISSNSGNVPSISNVPKDNSQKYHDTYWNRNVHNIQNTQQFTTPKPSYNGNGSPNYDDRYITPRSFQATTIRNNVGYNDNTNQYSSGGTYAGNTRYYSNDHTNNAVNNGNYRQSQNNANNGQNHGFDEQNKGHTGQIDHVIPNNGLNRQNSGINVEHNDYEGTNNGLNIHNNGYNLASDGFNTLDKGHSSPNGNSVLPKDYEDKSSYGAINLNTGYPYKLVPSSKKVDILRDPIPNPSIHVAERQNIARMKRKIVNNIRSPECPVNMSVIYIQGRRICIRFPSATTSSPSDET